MIFPVGAWFVAHNQSIRSVGGHGRNLTTSYFERKETKLAAARQQFMVEIALFYVFPLSNSLVLCLFDSSFI